MEDVVVRRIREDEVQEHRALRLAALADAPGMFIASYDEEAARPDRFWEERTHRGAAGEEVATFVALAGAAYVGTATGLAVAGGRVELVGMWVAPAVRGVGVGRSLVQAVCDWAAQRGASRVELEVRPQNAAARRLYERAGFTTAPHAAASTGCLAMRRPLGG